MLNMALSKPIIDFLGIICIINCLLHKMQRGLSSTSSGMEELASSSPFLAILEEIENISVDLLADKEKKKRVKKKTESSTAS